MAFWNSIGGAVGRAYDYLTPGKGSSRLTDWGGWGDRPSSGGGGGGGGGGWGTPAPASTPVADDSWARESAALQAELRRLQAQVAAQPRLASFDVMANWQQAKSAAERAQNPLYEKKLNDFLARNAQKKASKTRQFNLTKEDIATERAQTVEDNQITRQRTAEDVQMAVDKLNKQEGEFQQDEGRNFDVEYRQMAEELAAGGAADTGIGKQASYDAIKLRNITSQRQLDEFKGQREAKLLFKDRTFDDLLRGDQRADVLATSKNKAAQFDYEDYLNELAYDEKTFRFQNEAERLEAVLRDAGNYEKAGVEAFLAGLVGQGYSARDIAYNREIYT